MKSVDLSKPFRREFNLSREGINDDARTVELCFATEAEVERDYGFEVLDMDERSVRMERMKSSAPLLLNHDSDKQIGVVESARVDGDKKARAVVRFSKSALGQEIFQDVKDGIRSLVSVGYRVHKFTNEKPQGRPEVYRATDWEPLEISIVAVPADVSAGVGRALPESTNQADANNSEPEKTMSAVSVEVKSEDVRANERKRIADIRSIAARHKADNLVDDAIDKGISPDEFGARVLAELAKRDNSGVKDAAEVSPETGLSEKEVGQFSLRRACLQLATRGKLDGLEAEADKATRAKIGREVRDNAFVIPHEVFTRSFVQKRANNVTTATAGGFLVGNQFGPMIELLRNRTVVAQAGATQLSGLVNDVILPKHTGGAVAYWVSETGSVTDSQGTFGQVKLSPHRLGASVPYSTQLLAQASIDVESLIRNDLLTALAIEKDRAALHGAGGAEPIGVAGTSGINATVTYGGAAVWADVVEHETGIAVDNADIGVMGFILSASTVGKWKTILRDSVAGAGYLIDNSMMANGYQVYRTNQVSGNKSFFGVWNQLVMASWAGVEVIVDPYALKKSGQVEITVNELCDIAVRQPLAFNVSTDSAAQ
jgi:HK97 family phage major capsid protein/HK97 family phage prohead protease